MTLQQIDSITQAVSKAAKAVAELQEEEDQVLALDMLGQMYSDTMQKIRQTRQRQIQGQQIPNANVAVRPQQTQGQVKAPPAPIANNQGLREAVKAAEDKVAAAREGE